jgi:hypothetical protein
MQMENGAMHSMKRPQAQRTALRSDVCMSFAIGCHPVTSEGDSKARRKIIDLE